MDVVFFEIGSKPLADVGILPRKPSDIDLFGPVQHIEDLFSKLFPRGWELHSKSLNKTVYRCNLGGGIGNKRHVMVEVEDCFASQNSKDIYNEMLFEHFNAKRGACVIPANINWLLFFKESHKFKKDSVHFLKTLNDIKLLREVGAEMPVPIESALFKERERLTYTNKLPNLNVKSGEFFNPNTVRYKYDHDSLHRAVALYDKPAYLYYKHPDKEVFCSEELFFAQTQEIRLAGVYEEACVLALERSLIPFDFKPSPHKAFAMALEKVATSITSGFFREFSYRNYHEVLRVYNTHGRDIYVQRFHRALESGIILPFESTTAVY